MINIANISKDLDIGKDGIWFSRSQVAISYPDQGNEICSIIEDDSYWFQHRNNCITNIVHAFPPSEAVFDVGGGNGVVSKKLQTEGIEVVLVEPGIVGARNEAARGVKPVICSTLENAHFEKGSLPAVGLFDVIEHIENDSLFLITLKDLMVPNGRLYITAPAYNFLWSEEDAFAGHFRRYSITGLADALSKAGFNVIFDSYFFSLLVVPVFLLRTVPSRLKIYKSVTQEQAIKEHSHPHGIIGKLLRRLFRMEITMLKSRRRIPFGGSCLIVAEKR